MASKEPPTKKAKTEEKPAAEEAEEKTEEVAKEEPKKAEPPKELETDAKPDKTPKISDKVAFLTQDTTLNVAESMFGNMLTCLSDGGLQYLLAGARANVGIKSGRYMFEVNVVELMHQKQDTTVVTGRAPQPRNFFRMGLSTAGSSLLIGEDEHSICFDAEGSFIHNKKKTSVGAKFERSMNVALVVNVDSKSPNANTVSLFRDGVRICEPQALPDSMKGKALYPTLSYRNVTVHYNFGAVADSTLPFTCRMLQDASAKDVEVTKEDAPKDGKYTAAFPVCLPDEGGFQWLDAWLKENPSYTEMSDRAILKWCEKSGIARNKTMGSRPSNDKPDMQFGLPMMDDKSIQKVLSATVGLQRRNFVVMEMHANLMKDSRSKLLASFTEFKKVALVVAGEPPSPFKKMTQEAILEEKQAAANADFKRKLDEEKRKKAAEKKVAADAKKKEKADKLAKKQAEERKQKLQAVLKKREDDKAKAEADKIKIAAAAKKKMEKAAAKKAAEAKGEVVDLDDEVVEDLEEEDVKVEEVKAEEEDEKKDEEDEKESEEEPMEVEEADPDPPKVALDDDEKAKWFKPTALNDLSTTVLNANFDKYTLPEKSEGFDEVKFEWQDSAKSAQKLASWKEEKKITARIEDLQIGDWFTDKQKLWTEFTKQCKQKQNDYKAGVAKKASDKAMKEKMKAMRINQAKQKAVQDKAAAEAKKKLAVDRHAKMVQIAEGKEKLRQEKIAKLTEAGTEVPEELLKEPEPVPDVVEEPEPVVEAVVEEEEDEEMEEEHVEVDVEGVEVFGVEDITEIGSSKIKQPFFSSFQFEDWALMSLRFELNLLIHAFRKDVKDPERTAIHEDNITFYYQKYFKKGLQPSYYGLKTIKELLGFFEDTITVTNKKVMDTFLPGDFESHNVFVLLAEEARRDRNRRIDLGEEGAKIIMQSATGLLGMQMQGGAQQMGVNAGQMSAISNFAAANAQRQMQAHGQAMKVASPYGQVGVRPMGMMGQGQMVRPPAQAWAQPQQAWGTPRPMGQQMGMGMGGAGAWGPAAGAGAWGAGPQASPYGMMGKGGMAPRPAFGGMLRPQGMWQGK